MYQIEGYLSKSRSHSSPVLVDNATCMAHYSRPAHGPAHLILLVERPNSQGQGGGPNAQPAPVQ